MNLLPRDVELIIHSFVHNYYQREIMNYIKINLFSMKLGLNIHSTQYDSDDTDYCIMNCKGCKIWRFEYKRGRRCYYCTAVSYH